MDPPAVGASSPPDRSELAPSGGRGSGTWSTPPRGGHFAALEQPARLVEDVQAFFRKVR
ncbi:MAG: hypothetical protein ACYDEN_05705 [Acidimicrobiales bacterium]